MLILYRSGITFVNTVIICLCLAYLAEYVRYLMIWSMLSVLRSDSAALYNLIKVLELMMLSPMELQHVIESAFLPLRCSARIDADQTLAIAITGPDFASRPLTVTGVAISSLNSARAIAQLVMDLKEEYRLLQSVETKCKRWK